MDTTLDIRVVDEPAEAMVVKDVQAELLLEKKSRRKPGQVVYPLVYSSEIMDFDNWDHMFLQSCCRSLTMHQFTNPPPLVLDLGCGGGLWAIEAAKQWKESTIIGFDMVEIQPGKAVLEEHAGLGKRVQWVHGSLLDGLPFASNYFDFIRIVGIGLGVPEDEWQFVLEEVSRVLKPGCPLEIIEEDLIFPCGRPPKSRPPPLIIGEPSFSASASSVSVPSTTVPSIGLTSQTLITPQSSLTLISESWSSSSSDDTERSPSYKANSFVDNHSSHYSSFASYSPTLLPQPRQLPEVHDHMRLKAAWEAMLASRFLPLQLLTVLPFYLSSLFTGIQSHPSLQIPLPPNSHPNPKEYKRTWQKSIDPDIFSDLRPACGRPSTEVNIDTLFFSPTKTSHRLIPSWAPMHLARNVRTISACKEAIWVEYDKLNGNDQSLPPVTRTSRQKHIHHMMTKTTREEFEKDWSNWQHDMMDRIGARDMVHSEFLWDVPRGERPDWRIWNEGQMSRALREKRAHGDDSELCRTLRGFVCWKPSRGG